MKKIWNYFLFILSLLIIILNFNFISWWLGTLIQIFLSFLAKNSEIVANFQMSILENNELTNQLNNNGSNYSLIMWVFWFVWFGIIYLLHYIFLLIWRKVINKSTYFLTITILVLAYIYASLNHLHDRNFLFLFCSLVILILYIYILNKSYSFLKNLESQESIRNNLNKLYDLFK